MSACNERATAVLFEVYGRTTLPVGAFCNDHFHQERNRLHAEGVRTGVSALRPEESATQPCCWEPPAAKGVS